MSILALKQGLLLPCRELLINASCEIRGRKTLLASLTEQEGEIKLWVFTHYPELAEPWQPPGEYASNRAEIMERAARRLEQPHMAELVIQGLTLPTSGSAGLPLEHNPQCYMKIQHFLEAGVDFSPLEDAPLAELVLCEYSLAAGTSFPEIDKEKALAVSLRLADESSEILLEQPLCFTLELGEQAAIAPCSFYDRETEQEITFFIDRVIRYDFHKEMAARCTDESDISAWRESDLSDEDISRMRENVRETVEKMCPEGQELLLLQYETPGQIQLNFYDTAFLADKPQPPQGSSSSAMIFGSDDEGSIHGQRPRTCLLKTVPRGFSGPVQVELVSWWRHIPGEWIEVM